MRLTVLRVSNEFTVGLDIWAAGGMESKPWSSSID
jgi:hypothetical protein